MLFLFNTSAQKSSLKCFSIQNILMNNTFQVKQILLILSSKFLLMKWIQTHSMILYGADIFLKSYAHSFCIFLRKNFMVGICVIWNRTFIGSFSVLNHFWEIFLGCKIKNYTALLINRLLKCVSVNFHDFVYKKD